MSTTRMKGSKKVKRDMPPSDNMRRLEFLRNAKPPMCCGQPMEVFLLSQGDKTEEQKERMTEREYADYVIENSLLPPVWSCEKCEEEQDIDGLDWPESTPDKVDEPPKTTSQLSFCPHCGKRLPDMVEDRL